MTTVPTLPAGWERVQLGALLEFKYGKGLPAKKRDGNRFPVYGSNGVVGWHSKPLVEGPAIIVGRKGSIGEVHLEAGACSPIDTTYYIDEFHRMVPEYWLHQLRALPLNEMNRASAIPGLNRQDAYELTVGLPPLNEQRRIVDKIEALTAKSRRAKEALDAIPPLLERFRQSVLAAAFRGDLTADWRAQNPDVEPADQLLARIRKERRARWEEAELAKMRAKGKEPKNDKWKAKYKEPEIQDHSGFPALPESWCYATLGHFAWFVKDGPHHSPKYADRGIPFISGRNVRRSGVDFSDAKYISRELHERLSERCVPELGDILYTKGGTTGIARVNTYDRDFNVWVHVAVLKLVPSVKSFFLQHMLNSPKAYRQAQKFTHGVGNQDLGLTRMVKIVLPVAPLPEQNEMIRRVDELLEIADRVEQVLEGTQTTGEKLDQAILAKAFRGELVPQQPNDEPASILLERIRAEREKARPKNRKPRRKRKRPRESTDSRITRGETTSKA